MHENFLLWFNFYLVEITYIRSNRHRPQPSVLKSRQPLIWQLHAQVSPTYINNTHSYSTNRDEVMMIRGGRRGGKGGGSRVVWTAPVWSSSGWRGPGRATFRECRHLGLLPFCEKSHNKDTKTGRCQDSEGKSGRTRQWHRDAKGMWQANTPWFDRDLGEGWGIQKGERTTTVTASGVGMRRRSQGQEMEAVLWRATGNIKVVGASQQEIRWGAGENSYGFK